MTDPPENPRAEVDVERHGVLRPDFGCLGMGRENPVVVSQVRASHGEHTIVAEVHAAPGQDLTLWRTAWSPAAGVAQAHANKETLDASWAAGGTAPMHIIQAAAVEDAVLEFSQK